MSIDAKGDPKFLTINKKADWEKGYIDNLTFPAEAGGIQISSGTVYKIVKAVPVKDITGDAGIIDIVSGCPGVLYILCSEGYLLIYDLEKNFAGKYDGTGGEVVFSGARKLLQKGGVLYITGSRPEDEKNGFITAIDLETLEVIWESDSLLIPQDFACDEIGNLYLLEEDMGIVKIDRNGNSVDRYILDYTTGHIGQFEAIDEDILAVYDSISNTMTVVDLKSNIITDMMISINPIRKLTGLYSGCDDGIYTLEHIKSAQVNKRIGYFTRYCMKNGKYQGETLVSGRISRLCTGHSGKAYVLNDENGELLFLNPEKTMISKDAGLLPQGTYISHPLDSTIQDTRWHRMELKANIPQDTQVSVSFITSNDISAVTSENYLFLPWSKPVINPYDALIEAQPGRYLWIKIDLTGTINVSPEVTEITAYFPRISYLGYLPAVYQEDKESRDFLEGFLSLFETFFMDTEKRIDNIAALFDPDSAPAEFLNYLAHWLSLPVSEYWDEERLRQLMGEAAGIYKMRGTREGIRRILEIFLKNKVFIVENFQIRNAKKIMNEEKKAELEEIFGDDPYSFHIFVNKVQKNTDGRFSAADITDNDITEVRRITELEKPAYTRACVKTLESEIVLDGNTYMGINTFLRDPRQKLDKGDHLRECNISIDIEDMKIDFNKDSS